MVAGSWLLITGLCSLVILSAKPPQKGGGHNAGMTSGLRHPFPIPGLGKPRSDLMRIGGCIKSSKLKILLILTIWWCLCW